MYNRIMSKTCTVCKVEKSLTEFNKHKARKDGLQTICKTCTRERFNAYYANNREKQRKSVRERNLRIIKECREYLAQHFSDNPCVDCGETDIRVLEFDHVRGGKLNGVAGLIRSGKGLSAVKAEIEKCEVRCKNCHTIATYERMGGTWHDAYMGL